MQVLCITCVDVYVLPYATRSEDEEEAAITGPDGVPVNPTEAAPTLENKENTAITEAEETKEV